MQHLCFVVELQAAVYGKNETFFFVNPAPVQTDGRFELQNYTCWVEKANGERIDDSELLDKYTDIILEHIAPLLIYE